VHCGRFIPFFHLYIDDSISVILSENLMSTPGGKLMHKAKKMQRLKYEIPQLDWAILIDFDTGSRTSNISILLSCLASSFCR
jgi:hypothetical protein